jgi:2-alkyl-3-oxoalkanoate reductase
MSEIKRVLITGGGGFLGSNLAQALVKRKIEVVTISRSAYPQLAQIGVKTIQGDITKLDDLLNAAKGVDAIFHTAAKVSMWGRWSDFYSTNVKGSKNVITTCQQLGIKRLIYTSTPSVVFGGEDLLGVNESTPYPQKYISRYAKSKMMAEKLILATNGVNGLLTVALRPHLIVGPGDPNLVPKLLSAAKEGRLKIVGNGENVVDVIHIDRAVDAHLNALNLLTNDSPICGQAYFLGEAQPVKLWEFINQILVANNVPQVKKKLPFTLAYLIGGVMELGATILGRFQHDLPMTRFVAQQFSYSHYFDHKKAVEQLNFTPGPGVDPSTLH